MPFHWTDTAPDHSGAVSFHLVLWPHRSLPRQGFVWFIAVTACLSAMPLIGVVGTTLLWGLLPFALIVLTGLWIALQRSYRTGQTREELTLSHDSLTLVRNDPGRETRKWETNPYWVRVALRKGPVEDYLTLSDGKREVELGAFLTPAERRNLLSEIQKRLASLR